MFKIVIPFYNTNVGIHSKLVFIQQKQCYIRQSTVSVIYAKYCVLAVFYTGQLWNQLFFEVGDVAELVRASDFQCW